MEDKLILLVEDNPHIMAINDAALHMRGYRTLQAETAHKCRELLCFHAVDLIVLDILLPDGDGVALCREIKQEYDVPILFLTAMGENEDIVKGLTAGGDDYLTKPYDLEVFMARVEARLRAAHPKERAVRLGPLQMNLLSGRAYIGETDLNLTQKEFAALLYLALLSAVAYSLWAVLLRVNPVSRVAVYTFLQPIFGVILSLLLVDRNSDAPLLRYAAALAMICVSIAVVNRGQRQEEEKIKGSAH